MNNELTAAETAVANLAIKGHTNRQIAGRLVVTVKAVEWHLANVYRKCGVSRRGDLATALMRPKPTPPPDLTAPLRVVPKEDRALYLRVADLEEQVERLTRLLENLSMTLIERVS